MRSQLSFVAHFSAKHLFCCFDLRMKNIKWISHKIMKHYLKNVD